MTNIETPPDAPREHHAEGPPRTPETRSERNTRAPREERHDLSEEINRNQRRRTRTDGPRPDRDTPSTREETASRLDTDMHPVHGMDQQELTDRSVKSGLVYGGVTGGLTTAAAIVNQGLTTAALSSGLSTGALGILTGARTYLGGKMHNMVWARNGSEEPGTLGTFLRGIVSPITVPFGVIRNALTDDPNTPEETKTMSKEAGKAGLVTGGIVGGTAAGIAAVGLAPVSVPIAVGLGIVGGAAGIGTYLNGVLFHKLWKKEGDSTANKPGTLGMFLRGLIPFGAEAGLVRNLTWNRRSRPQTETLPAAA